MSFLQMFNDVRVNFQEEEGRPNATATPPPNGWSAASAGRQTPAEHPGEHAADDWPLSVASRALNVFMLLINSLFRCVMFDCWQDAAFEFKRQSVRSPLEEQTMSLNGAVICFTGFSPDVKEDMSKRVRHLGGKVSRELTDSVTHLVAESCDPESQKYNVSNCYLLLSFK